jgi:hypothetical protein
MEDQHNPEEIQVFKTDVRTKKDRKKLEPVLNADVRILQWNLDLADCDKVLRIQSRTLVAWQVINLLRQTGYCCEELPD